MNHYITYGELYMKCKADLNIDASDINDWRPARPLYHEGIDIDDAIIIWKKDGSKDLYILENETWTVRELESKYGKNMRHSQRSAEIWKRENEKTYSDVINMSNKEAAAIIRNVVCNVQAGRGCGKTLSLITMQSAFAKAIKLLEETPDTATDIVEKEAKNRFVGTYRGLRAMTMAVDEFPNFGPFTEQEKAQYERYRELVIKPLAEEMKEWVSNPEWRKGIQPTYFSLDEFPLTNEHSPEDIRVRLEKKKEAGNQNDAYIIKRDKDETDEEWRKRAAKILGMVTDRDEEEAMDRVDAFLKIFTDMPLTNAHSPEDIRAGLENAQNNQNDGETLPEKEENK